MGKEAHGRTESQLHEAESEGSLFVVHDDATRRCLERMVKRGEVFKPARGIYVRADYWRSLSVDEKALHMMRALSHRDPTIVFSHVSAALAHGLEVPWRHVRKLHAVTDARHPSRSDGWVIHHPVGKVTSVVVGGIAVTELHQTIFDCLRTLDLAEGLAVADSALRSSTVDADSLARFFDERKGIRGYRHAVQTLGLANPLSENGGESIARGTMLELGCMPPELQVEVIDPLSGAVYRADFFWTLADGSRVIGELDGMGKYLDPTMTGGKNVESILLDERLRESRINANGTRVMRFRFEELRNRERFSELLDLFCVPRGLPGPKHLRHPSLYDGVTFRRRRNGS